VEHNQILCQFNSVQTIKLMNLTLLIHGETIDNSDIEKSHKLMIMMMMNWLTHGEVINDNINTLRTGLFKLFKQPLPGFLTILTL